MSGPRRASGSWRERQERDPYVLKSRRDGYRSRAVYKLAEIDRKEKLLFPGMVCVDLGSSPGSWCQFVTERLKNRCRILALDLLEMDCLPSVEFIQGDFTDEDVLRVLLETLGDDRANLVISDMAPNISGNRSMDQPRSMLLAELALDLARQVLKPGGDFVSKLFQGAGSDEFLLAARSSFERVRVIKPDASRAGSREIYLVARNYQVV